MKITRFYDLITWQKARLLATSVYKQTYAWRDFGLKDQLQRAAVSVMSNIAEGYGRKSSKEFLRYLTISSGSCMEVQSLLCLGLDLHYLSPVQHTELDDQATEVIRLIRGLSKTISF